MERLIKNKFRSDSIRLQTWNYTNPGWYFVTICTKHHNHFFGEISGEKFKPNKVGNFAELFWRNIPKHFPFIELDYYVFMPNHCHGVLIIDDHSRDVASARKLTESNVSTFVETNRMSDISPKKYSLSSVIRSYKASVTKWCRNNGYLEFAWQPRFFDRIIRNEKELYNIRKYIEQNPLKWEIEKNHPENINFDNV
jgi:putative transposase